MYTDQDISNLLARIQQLEMQLATRQATELPKTGLVSKNFLTRAFTVWGHYFISSFLIGLIPACLFLILGLIFGQAALVFITQLFSQLTGSLLGGFMQ